MKQEVTAPLEVLPQPNDSTCGPTCLHAVYRYFQDDVPLEEVISQVTPLPGGGSLAVSLAHHALKRGYQAEIYTYNLQVFDPTWFAGDIDIAERLQEQLRHKPDPKLSMATKLYLEFLSLGGKLRYEALSESLLARVLGFGTPILTGLSATYLYECARESAKGYDDVAGFPTGHFVVLCGYDAGRRSVTVADPLPDNPGFSSRYYSVDVERLIASILLGILTYDANLLILAPSSGAKRV